MLGKGHDCYSHSIVKVKVEDTWLRVRKRPTNCPATPTVAFVHTGQFCPFCPLPRSAPLQVVAIDEIKCMYNVCRTMHVESVAPCSLSASTIDAAQNALKCLSKVHIEDGIDEWIEGRVDVAEPGDKVLEPGWHGAPLRSAERHNHVH